MNIEHVTARMILDSRGTPTVEADVWCAGGHLGRAAAPSGASTGSHEAHELRDNSEAFGGKGVRQAITNIQGEIKDRILGLPADDQFKLDKTLTELDGTNNKFRLGANAILAVSLAAAKAAASVRNLPLYRHINDIVGGPDMSIPMPMCNVLNGGRHASGSSDFQEYMLIPRSAESYRQGMQIVVEIFMQLKQHLHEHGFTTTVGDEGGFAPAVKSNAQMLDLLSEAVTAAGYRLGIDVVFALDVAASEFESEGIYQLKAEGRSLRTAEMIQYLNTMTQRYPIASIEDGLSEDAWPDWSTLTRSLPEIQLVGDDFLVTNIKRLQRAISAKAGNAILIKPNQIGTLTETVKAITLAKANGWNTIVSHRSGETEDTTIAHLAVGTGAGQIKTGSVSRGERTAKHNELLRIEETSNVRLALPF